MKLGIDIDGVLAKFDIAYIQVIKNLTGKQLPQPSDTYPDVWDYDKAAGVTNEEIGKAWGYIKSSPFWGSLPAYPGAVDALQRLNSLGNEGHQIYFITFRPGNLAKFWTELWLQRHGMELPTVLLANSAQDKGDMAKGLHLDVFIDDKPENNAAVAQASPDTKVILIRRPWNAKVCMIGLSDVCAVKDINEALDLACPETEVKAA